MSSRRTAVAIVASLLILSGVRGHSADLVLISPGSVWRFNDSGLNLGTSWRTVTYNDGSWSSGPAQLGYGDGDESTVISYGSNPNNRRITYYFRRSFTVTNPSAIAALVVRFVRDDGCVIYLNGVEVVRSNMPTGSVSYTTRASVAIGGADESAWLEAPIDPARLVAGTNVIAVEVHQQSPTSSDVSFDLELRGTSAQTQAPAISLTSPSHQSVSNLATVTFTASASAAAGLADATLYLGDAPRTATFSGPIQIEDAQITADAPTTANGTGLSLNVDGQAPHAHALVKFPFLTGSGTGQVPPGSVVTAATLLVNCTNTGQAMRLYRLTQSWTEDEATWNERAVGLPWGSAGADGAASNAGVAAVGDCTTAGLRQIDITSFVQEWTNGSPNYGLVFIESGTDGIDFDSSESGSSPVLTIIYKGSLQPVQTQALAGSTAQVSFATTLALGRSYRWNVRATDLNGQEGWAASDFELTVDAASPDDPVLVSPVDGASGVETSPSLQVSVNNAAGGPLTVSAGIRPATAPEFTVIALPDTQHYSESFPAIFTAQTQWIVDNKVSRNIVFVTHEGDVVEHNSLASEWDRADASMSLLDGMVPYGMGPGNHDQPTTLFNQYFPYTRYAGLSWYGGHFQNLNDNNYQLFSGGGMDFVIVHLAFCPPAAAVAWADSIFKSYPDRIGIMTTHGYLGLGAVRSVHVCGSTQYLWDGLAPGNPNLRFMLSGHVHGEARRTDTIAGRDVFQMLADYQDRASGGEGWLRILRFVPADNKVYVQTYSPWLNRYETDADSEFTLDFDMGGGFASAGTVSVPSGTTASIPISGLSPNTQYEWRASVTNADAKTRVGQVWRFTTGTDGPVNQPPVATNQALDVTEDTATILTLAGSDPEGSPLSFSVVSGPLHGSLSGVAPSLLYQPAPDFNGPDNFTFRVSDGQSVSNTATVSIQVQPLNDPPGAVADAYSAVAGNLLTVSAPGVLGNDSDVDSGSLQAQLVTPPAHGSLTLNSNGSFSYAPSAGYAGPDSFSYVAFDGQANSGAVVVAFTVTLPVDVTPPTVAITAPVAGAIVSGTVTVTAAASDNVGVAGVQFLLDGVALGSEDTSAPYSISWNSTGSANGIHQLSARARDTNSNQSTAPVVSVTVNNVVTPPVVAGLVAAYSFNEGSGTTLIDRTGTGHTGTFSGPTWTTAGRFGGALSFDGVNDWVTIGDANDLDLTTGMTLEAWVRPSTVSGWRTIVMKERSGGLAYALYASNDASRADGYVRVSTADIGLASPAAMTVNQWNHVALTYDNARLRLFVNGVQLSERTLSGAVTTSTGVLRFGGNAVWSEFFQGQLDEVRVYNRALSVSEIQADMSTPVAP